MEKRTIKFFTITFIVTWLLWLPTVIYAKGVNVPEVLLLIGMFAGFSPTIVGLVMMKKDRGEGFKSYLQERLTLAFPKKWLLMMMIFPLISMISLVIVHILDKSFVVVNPISPIMAPLVFLQILFIGGAIGEEFGWRGYAMDKLQSKFGPFYGTLILGAIWSLWHLPLFFMLNTVQSHLPIWQFMLQNTMIAFFYTWIYNKTKGNLILMILLHAILNTTSAVFPYWQSDQGRYIGFALLLLTLVVIKIMDSSFLEVDS